MLRTKLALKKLGKKQQRHLTDMNIHSLAAFKNTRAHQLECIEIDKKAGIEFPSEPCWDCRKIAEKLGMD